MSGKHNVRGKGKRNQARYCPDCGGVITKEELRTLAINVEQEKRKGWCFTCSQCRKIYGVDQVLKHKPSGALWKALKEARGNR